MQAIIILLNAIFAILTTAVNKSFTKSQRGTFTFRMMQNVVTGVFNPNTTLDIENKTMLDIIIESGRGAGLYTFNIDVLETGTLFRTFTQGFGGGSQVIVNFDGNTVNYVSSTGSKLNAAVSIAKDFANEKADFAEEAAVTRAAQDATTKANTAKTGAVADAKIYTDSEIAKLQLYASKGIKSLQRYGAAVENGVLGNGLPSSVALSTTEVGFHIVEVEIADATTGATIFDVQANLTVPTYINNVVGTTVISVSTEDEIMLETIMLDGVPYSFFVKLQNVRVLEMFNQLSTKIETQVSETELNNALETIKTFVTTELNAALA